MNKKRFKKSVKLLARKWLRLHQIHEVRRHA